MDSFEVIYKIKQSLDGHRELHFAYAMLNDFPSGEIYLVGGAVRDAILDRECKDFDFVVRGIPSGELERWLANQGQVDFVGRNFGVYKFLPAGCSSPQFEFIDIALPRTEETVRDSQGGYRDFEISTHPFLPILYDLERRDFTINAIAYELRSQMLYDPYNGVKDIQRQIIRTVGEPTLRFSEDLSRMLRALRFSVQLQFKIEEKTLASIHENIHRINELRVTVPSMMDKMFGKKTNFVVPRETIGKEFVKSVVCSADQTLRLWKSAGAFQVLKMGSGPDNGFISIDEKTVGHYLARLPALFSSLGIKSAVAVYDEFLLGNIGSHHPGFVSRDVFTELIAASDILIERDPLAMSAHEFEKYFLTSHVAEIFIVAELRAHLAGDETASRLFDRTEAAKKRRAEIYTRLDIAPGEIIPPLLSGDEIMAITQTKPSPKVGELINKLRNAQLEGEINSKVDAIEYIK